MRILLDTNLLIDVGLRDGLPLVSGLPPEEHHDFFCSTLTYAELQEGEFSADATVRARAPLDYHRVTEYFGEGLPFDDLAAYLYRIVCKAVAEHGRQVGRTRRIDLMIAAVAMANDCVLATRNSADFEGLAPVLSVIQL